jgi:Ca2+-binding EF-hand superfamily protein
MLEEWVKWSFNQFGGGNSTLTRQQMKLSVISLTGKKPTNLTPKQSSFTLSELYQYIHYLNEGSILGDISLLYDEIDQTGQGFIQIEDLLRTAQRNKANLSVAVLQNAFSRADTDHDGRISYRDFLSTVKIGLIELGISSH